MMEINMLGKACPIPVIEARKAIQGLGETGGIIKVIVDNEIACENLKKMADGLGYQNKFQAIGEEYFEMEIIVGESRQVEVKGQKVTQTVVSIGRDTMGQGEEALGKILIKGFIYSLTELEELPSHILFFNSGVKLACKGANTIEDIKKLETLGCKVYVCGTCIDYYQKKEELLVGEITNMYGIVGILNESKKNIQI